MTRFNQERTGQYVSAGTDRRSLDDRRAASAAFVGDTVYDADKKFGIDPADLRSLAELVDAEVRLEHISHDVSPRSVVAPSTSRGDTA